MLQQIDVNSKDELKELASEMGLTTTERLKFQLILKKVPKEKQSLDVCHPFDIKCYDRHYHISCTNIHNIQHIDDRA